MREFWKMVKRYISPYRAYLGWSVVLNIFSALFNIFSFALIVPMLRILFGISGKVYSLTSIFI